jgi:hypothetical protein
MGFRAGLFGGQVNNKDNLLRPEEIHRLPSCMIYGIIFV